MKYVIFGPGRVGASVHSYLVSLGHETRLLSRHDAVSDRGGCERAIKTADVVAAAIPDSSLNGWFQDWRSVIGGRPAIHFSGALAIDGMASFHPLYSFPKDPLPADRMRRIAFAVSENAPAFSSIFPGADNPVFLVSDAQRAYYHALAVISGNFAAHLWNETAASAERDLKIDPELILAPYFESLVDRFREAPSDSVTGPVARRDRASVAANLRALQASPRLRALYEAFLASAWPRYPDE